VAKSPGNKKIDPKTPVEALRKLPSENRYAARLRAFSLETYFHLLLIAVVGFMAYSNTFLAPFQLDDVRQIQNNSMIRDLDNFLLALEGHDFAQGPYKYIPSRFVGYLSFALNYHFGGVDVRGYHLTNLFIHIANALLVYFFVKLTFATPYFRDLGSGARDRQTIGSEKSGNSRFTAQDSPFTFSDPRLIALFASLLFVSHPLQTQAITYVVQRFASLAALFYLLSVVLYIKGRLAVTGPGRWGGKPGGDRHAATGKEEGKELRSTTSRFLPVVYFSLSLVSAILAMRTKEIAFTLPLVIILYEFLFFKAPLKKRLLFLLPVALTLVIVPLSIMHGNEPLGRVLSDINERTRVETEMPRWDYLMTEMRVVTTYIRLIFLPVNQNLDYDYPIYHSFTDLPVLLSFLFLSAIIGFALFLVYSTRSEKLKVKSEKSEQVPENLSPFTFHLLRLTAFGILWFFITLSVESSIIPIEDVIFEHRVYLPSVGFLIAITAGLFALAGRLRKEKIAVLLLTLTTLALSAATYARNDVWKDSISFWEDVVRKSPNLARPHNNLGTAYDARGRKDEAMREFQTAVSLKFSYPDAHYNVGMIYLEQGRLDEAKKEFQAAAWLIPDDPDAHFNLGKIYALQGLPYDAINEYQTVLKLDPDYAKARIELQALTKKMGR